MDVLNSIIQLLRFGFVETVVMLFILKAALRKYKPLWSALFLLSNCILLCTSILFSLVFLTEIFIAWYSQVEAEQAAFVWRITGPYWYTYWIMILVPICAPQLFWIRKVRRSAVASLMMVPLLFIGVVMERLIIYLASFRDYRPAAWTSYSPTVVEVLLPLAAFGAVLTLAYFTRRRLLSRNITRPK